MNAPATLLKSAVKKIVDEYQPEKIILFGSRAHGDERPDSDYDFIIIKNTNTRWIRRALEIPAVPFQADFFVYTPDEFQRMRKQGNVFLESALSHHTVLYERVKKK